VRRTAAGDCPIIWDNSIRPLGTGSSRGCDARDWAIGRGPKSADLTRSTSLPVALTKRELVKRAAKWGAPRGFELRDSLRGIRSRDQILIMLFLNGHGVKPFEVREPIGREFGRARAKLNALTRSSRFDEEGQVPPKHKRTLVRSLGPGDERFVKAGVILPPDQMIAAVRAARSPDPDSKLRTIISPGAEDWRLQILKPALGGILSKDPEIPAEIDQIIANATDADLTLASSILNSFRAVLSWLESKNRSPEIAGLLDGLLASFDLPLNFHPAAIRASADFTPWGAG
jgi:hypothetical protein